MASAASSVISYAPDSSNAEAAVYTLLAADFAAAATMRLASDLVWKPLSDDASFLEGRWNSTLLNVLPLWLPNSFDKDWHLPSSIDDAWRQLRQTLRSATSEDWEVWLEWYEARLHGRDPWADEVEVACALIPDELWSKGPAVVNGEIRRIREGGTSESAQPDPNTSIGAPPSVPPQKPAALQPEFRDEKLVLPKSPAASRLKGKSPATSLKVLRQELRDLADAVLGEANIDKRVPSRLREIADTIPDRTPRQDVLFLIGHAFEELQAYSDLPLRFSSTES